MATRPARALLGVLREALLDAWAVVQPVDCLGCGTPDRALCPACRAAVVPARPGLVRCDARPGVPVIAAADYAGPVRSALLALKDDGRTDAARPLARLLLGALQAVGSPLAPLPARPPGGVELAWVPSRPAALRRRGLDPVREIVAAARLPASRVLAARSAGPAQKTLGRADRLASGGRLRARRSLAGRVFVLIDDVVTTGATIADGVRAIHAAGGAVAAAVAVCAPRLDARRTRSGGQ